MLKKQIKPTYQWFNTLNIYFSWKHHLIHDRCLCWVFLFQALIHGVKLFPSLAMFLEKHACKPPWQERGPEV